MALYRKTPEQILSEGIPNIQASLAKLCSAFTTNSLTEGTSSTGTINASSHTWSGSSDIGYRKLLVDLDKCISFTVKVTLSDGSVYTHRVNNKSAYYDELKPTQADIVEVEVTDLIGGFATTVTINLLTI